HDENGEVHYRYPKIRLTGVETVEGVTTEILDPNKEDSGITVEIFNSSGEKVDGTEGNDLGTKMVVTFEKGATEGVVIKKDALDSRNNLTIINPLRVPADTTEDGDESDPYQFQFIQPAEDKIPKIRTVTPSTVTVSGEKGVKIEGQGFSEKFNLYINGVKNNTAKRNGTGTEIIFDAPATNQEGYVQIIVQNDDGALAIYDDFLYVKTYTDPKITDFNPKKGTYNTLVTLKGQNLLPPNPLVADIESGIGLLQLIGTRVFIGGKDINTYTDQGLQPYKAPSTQPLIDTEEGNIVRLSEDAHSIILQAGEKATNNVAYYKVYFDTYTGKTMLTDGNREVYEIIAEGTQLYGLKGGDKFAIIVGQESIKIEEKTLKFMTPYAKEDFKNQAGEKDGDRITGNRVKVVNHHELTFTVPSLAREGYYDVAIVNPDTKKDERRGNQGFYYSFQPQNLPEISRIEPTEGSVDGGYDVYIYGKNFVSGGTVEQKSTVTIGGVTVPPEDVEVSYDKTYIRFKVPKYPGDLATETEMDRKYVPIVVTNPDGGSAHIDGFAYIIPISNPEIFKLVLEGGSAAGGRTVRVEGQDFRYFEPFRDTNNNGIWDVGEPFTDKNGNGIWDNLLDEGHFERLQKTAGGWDKNILPILPKVYFGNQLATVTDFGPGLLVVETPKGIKGPAQVYVVNNDYGVSNKVPYTYET
ncbi:MAG: hypothetical protein GX962_10435, partial [Epulopiscium sp.]|nr:hypothetical protein [Candidatus Epulonipiscium sp.]